MADATVDHPRADALLSRIAQLDGAPGRREAVALGLVDALLAGDEATLGVALDALRDARARADGDREAVGWLDAAIAFAHWGLERAPEQPAVARGTQAHEFLRLLDDTPNLGSADLRRLLETDETQVSRTGRRLLESGLVTRRQVGRQVFWQLSPRGRRALDAAPSPSAPSPTSSFWQEALRRGFEAAHGDEPGEPRTVDPTRERIIETTLELHTTRGIKATTRQEIAEKTGVQLETLQELFPSEDELYRSCAAHVMERLGLPPIDLAPKVFAGAESSHDRVRRLVETSFGAYEREADGITTGRRERRDLPIVDESLSAIEGSLDALVAEALRPIDPRGSTVEALRALTDLEVWRALRDQGATPEQAVAQASEAVERWLEAQPAG